MNLTLLITGANGFVGRALCSEVLAQGAAVKGATRAPCNLPVGVENVVIGDIDGSTNWLAALKDCDAVIHLASRVHVMQETAIDPMEEFRRINVQGTMNLARQAAAAGVQRFVMISTIKVNGEFTQPGLPFTADDAPAPKDHYGASKMEAEEILRDISSQFGMDAVIIRPPLVYGLGVKANFAAMMCWLKHGLPLPLGAIYNQRSLVALDNLVDFILVCLTHPAARNQTFLVSDGEDVSTTDLLLRMSRILGCPARLIPVPAGWLSLVATILGKRDVAQRLCASLQVDIEKNRRLLGWTPLLSLDEGLRRAAGNAK